METWAPSLKAALSALTPCPLASPTFSIGGLSPPVALAVGSGLFPGPEEPPQGQTEQGQHQGSQHQGEQAQDYAVLRGVKGVVLNFC